MPEGAVLDVADVDVGGGLSDLDTVASLVAAVAGLVPSLGWTLHDSGHQQRQAVGNAGRGDFYVRALLFHGWLRVEVLDAYGRAPSLRVVTPDTRAEGGRGLVLVNALASRWGSFQSLRGPGMFFELRWRVPEPLAPVAPAVPLPRKDW